MSGPQVGRSPRHASLKPRAFQKLLGIVTCDRPVIEWAD